MPYTEKDPKLLTELLARVKVRCNFFSRAKGDVSAEFRSCDAGFMAQNSSSYMLV